MNKITFPWRETVLILCAYFIGLFESASFWGHAPAWIAKFSFIPITALSLVGAWWGAERDL